MKGFITTATIAIIAVIGLLIGGGVYFTQDMGQGAPATELIYQKTILPIDNADIGTSTAPFRDIFTGDLFFYDEIKPDGATCADGEILKKTGANNWDCAADNAGGGGGTGSNWQFGANQLFITPTTTPMGIIVTASSTISDLTVSSNSTTTGIMVADGQFHLQSVTKTQTLTATSQILSTTTVLNISSASDLIMTAIPLIATSTNGAILILRNVGNTVIDLQDNSVAGSGVYHGGTTCVVNPRDEVTFIFQSDADGTGNAGWIIQSHPNLAAEGNASIGNVRNVSGSSIAAGRVVYQTGFNVGQDRVTIDLADSDDPTKMPAVGYTNSVIANGANGTITIAGVLKDIVDTSGFAIGDLLYVDATAGEVTNVRPTIDDIQLIGIVTRSSAINGRIGVTGAGRVNDTPWNVEFTLSTTTSATTTNLYVSGTTVLEGVVSILGESFTNFTTYVRSLFSGGTGITLSSGTISFDCSEVEGTGINCVGESVTLDATGAWGGTLTSFGSDFWTYFNATTTDFLTEGSSNLYNQNHTGDVTGATVLTIGANKILESMLKAVDSPTDEECLTYEVTTGDFEWQACGGVALWTDGGDVTYLTSTTDDWAVGGTNSKAGFFFDVGLNRASTTDLFLAGNLGIATTTPTSSLSVTGGIFFDGNATSTGNFVFDDLIVGTTTGISIGNIDAGDTNGGCMELIKPGTNIFYRVYIDSAGTGLQVEIGNC